MVIYRRIIIAIAGILFLTLCGCGGKSQPSNFYMLSSPGPTARMVQELDRDWVAVAIGPLIVPEYLDRPQIVIRTSAHEISLSEFDRWAEPLGRSLQRALADNLSVMLNTDRIYVYPQDQMFEVDYELLVSVIRFDGEAGGDAVFGARWIVSQGEEQSALAEQKKEYRERVDNDQYESLVAAQSRTVAQLSRDIAEAIVGLASNR